MMPGPPRPATDYASCSRRIARCFSSSTARRPTPLALAQLARPYHAIIAHRLSHIEEDEAGAPGYLSGGAKIVALDLPLAKLTPAAVRATANAGRGVHHVKPRVLSLSEATELGTVYEVDEVSRAERSGAWL